MPIPRPTPRPTARSLNEAASTHLTRHLFCKTGLSLAVLGLLSAGQVDAKPWGGEQCPSRAALRQVVDEAFAAAPASALFEDRGSGAAGYSVALSRRDCGVFRYAVGQGDVQRQLPMRPETWQHLGSLSKPITAAVVVRLAAAGVFGPEGIDTPIDQLLSSADLNALTLGGDLDHPKCPAEILAVDRLSGQLQPATATCPDFSVITLRHLLHGNHGLFDYINEVDRDTNGSPDNRDILLDALLDAAGIPHRSAPASVDTAFELLAFHGLLANTGAELGGTSLADYETSFGNTGYSLLGVIAERATGVSLNYLLKVIVRSRLGGAFMRSVARPAPDSPRLAHPYLTTSGAELVGLPEDSFGVYPMVSIAGHPAFDTYELETFVATNSGGGAGSIVSTANTYRRFFRLLVTGRLLPAEAQAVFDNGFITIDQLPGVEYGFGVFRFTDPEFGPGFARSGQATGSGCQALHFDELGTTVVTCRNSVDAILGQGGQPPSSTPVGALARALVAAANPEP